MSFFLTICFLLLLLGYLMYGALLLLAGILGGLKGLYDGVQMARKNPQPFEITDWLKEKYFSKN